MAELKWIERQNKASQSLLQQGSQALRENNLDLARAALTEAAIVLDMAHEDTTVVRKLRAQAFNELGVVHQRAGDLQTSRNFHKQAATLCDLLLESGEDSFKGNGAATHLNLANLHAMLDEKADARGALERARELADSLLELDDQSVRMMASAIYMTKASMHGSENEFEEADESMTRGVELAREVIANGNTSLYVQAAQGCQQLSVLLFQGERYEEALKWGHEAEELSAEAFEELGQEVISLYVVSQVNLISYNEKLAKYADAENSLWKSIELVGNDPRLLKRGKDFYEHCRKQSNARLEAGDLPRSEVEEGYADVLDRIEELGGLEALEAQSAEADK